MNSYQTLFDKQKEFFYTDATKTYEWRIKQVNQLEYLLLENQDALRQALKQDFGKPLFEITVPLGNIKYYKDNLHKLMAPEQVSMPKGLKETGNSGIIWV